MYISFFGSRAVKEVCAINPSDTQLNPGAGMRFGLAALVLLSLMGVGAVFGWKYRTTLERVLFPENHTREVISVRLPRKPEQPEKKGSDLVLDEKTSVTGLSKLFHMVEEEIPLFSDKGHPRLMSLALDPKHYEMLKKPFRVELPFSANPSRPDARFILVRRLTHDGAVVIDADGRDNTVRRDFVLKNRGSRVSWFSPYIDRWKDPVQTLSLSDILDIQKILNQLGYPVVANGVLDKMTLQQIQLFQKAMGLAPDTVFGPQTMSLFYLMVK